MELFFFEFVKEVFILELVCGFVDIIIFYYFFLVFGCFDLYRLFNSFRIEY